MFALECCSEITFVTLVYNYWNFHEVRLQRLLSNREGDKCQIELELPNAFDIEDFENILYLPLFLFDVYLATLTQIVPFSKLENP